MPERRPAQLLLLDRMVWTYANEHNRVPDRSVMNLYCWPCELTHLILIGDVERLVYGFVGTVAEQNKSGTLAIADVAPPCLLDVLQAATDGDHFQFVDLTIINRGGDPG
jgi:hypothetical protein